jgi:hypothetical protein
VIFLAEAFTRPKVMRQLAGRIHETPISPGIPSRADRVSDRADPRRSHEYIAEPLLNTNNRSTCRPSGGRGFRCRALSTVHGIYNGRAVRTTRFLAKIPRSGK